jgi:hypothetical protein
VNIYRNLGKKSRGIPPQNLGENGCGIFEKEMIGGFREGLN